MKPVRVPWNHFPDVVIHSPEAEVKGHASYASAKSGDARAAMQLVQDQISSQAIEAISKLIAGTTVLTGKPFSAKINLTEQRLNSLLEKYADLEIWWKDHFGYGFDCLTESEARYLERSPDADTIRNKVTAAEQEGNR